MKRFGIFSLIIAMAIVSCRKEELIPIDETTWDDPKEIEGLYFKGILTEKDQVLPYAVIEVYQNEELVGEVITRQDGGFDTRDLKLEEGKHVTFNVVQDGYIPLAKRIAATKKITDLGKIFLNKPELIPGIVEPLENPGSNDLIVISGYVTTPDNQPVKDILVGLVFDIVEVSSTQATMDGVIVVTDDNGYYEGLLPKDQVFEYFVWQVSSGPCSSSSKILNNEDFTILGGLPVEHVGPFAEDVQLPTKNNANVPTTSTLEPFFIKLNANFLNCDNVAVEWGRVTGSVEVQGVKRHFDDRIGLGNWLNDSIGYCIDPTLPLDIIVNLKVQDSESGKSSEDLWFSLEDGNQDLGDIVVCSNPPVDKSYLVFIFKNQEYTLELGTESDPKNTFIRHDTLFAPSVLNVQGGSVSFYIPNYLDNSNINMHDLTFTINDENYKSLEPLHVKTVNFSTPGFISGFITDGLFKNKTTGQIINIENEFAGLVNIQY